MITQDYGYNHLFTSRRGDQSSEPDLWTVRVFYDNRCYYYDVNINDKDDFEHWASQTFDTDELSNQFWVEWR